MSIDVKILHSKPSVKAYDSKKLTNISMNRSSFCHNKIVDCDFDKVSSHIQTYLVHDGDKRKVLEVSTILRLHHLPQ